ncbi:ferrichrome siderophore receptor FcuA [Acetobacter indonesiensis NRIC 0313]|uniref:Ferrichrome siderophore receptor FcuA n=2 Tax=Acetobacter indonesiensis TaxID=104101 RepID=A0A6N3T323_9PROT|nr:TonB-dependent receptor [Acetobacter indonesiensis]GAN63438.1 ferrichrome siderophore receptor FcuA [Acetobacter indonesiensis]GBQ61172.1 ferrichrome siderophore receptor FcuA [Acetobacter indonesiensis NRIC 0313]GEN03556.1 TonB-dependent receptor [Acetobacter indonesiensis]
MTGSLVLWQSSRKQMLRIMLASVCMASLTAGAYAQSAKPADSADSAAGQTSQAASQDEQIVVKAKRRNQMEVISGGQLGALGTKKGLDVPFNIRSYTSSLILNQQSQTLGQVLENDPSVRTTYGYGNFSEMFVIRGFPVYGDDIAINGLYGITPRQLVSPQLFDQVQVLNGASAFLNGAAPGGSGIGGNINLMFKHAENTPITRVTGDYTSKAIGGGSLDVGRRFGQDKAYGLRLNVAGLSGQSAIDHERRHSAVLGADFDWHDDKTRISLDMNFQNQGVNWGRPGVFLGSGVTKVPRVPSASHNYGQAWTYNDLNYIFGMLNVEHDFSKYLTAYAAFGGMGGDEKGDYSSLTVTNGQTGAATNGAMYVPVVQTNESTRAGVRAHFYTGPVKHEVNAGGSGLWEEFDTAYAMASGSIASNLYHPTYTSRPANAYIGGNVDNPQRNSFTRLYSLYFSDTMSFWKDRISLTAGFRYQNMLLNGYAYNGGAMTSHYDRDAITPVVGLVIRPTRQTSIYFNRIEGLAQGPQATGNVVNLGQIFPPYKSVQYEIGAKYDTGRFSTTLAFYQTSQPNSYTEPFGNTGQLIFRADGMQRNRGAELTVNGQILPGLRFNGGATLIDANLRKTGDGTNNGHTAIGVPNYTINGNLEYDLPFLKGGTVIGRVVNTGKQWVNTANTLHIPVWTRFDLALRYTFAVEHKPLTLRFGVDNIANTRYWASAFNGYLLQGLPRTFKFSFTADL